MHKRKLLIGLLVAGLFTAGLGAGLVPAAADQRSFHIEFLGGTSTDVTLDIPADLPLDQVRVPGVSLTIVSIQETTPPPAPTTTAAPATTTPAEQPKPQKGTDKPKGDKSASEPVASKQTSQKTTGDKKR